MRNDDVSLVASSRQQTLIQIGCDIFGERMEVCRGKAFLVADSAVYSLHRDYIEDHLAPTLNSVSLLKCVGGEEAKSIGAALRLVDRLLQSGISRNDVLVGIGGGSITDVTAFIAQMLFRGISLVLVPTTLLAQVDAAIGGKNGVDVAGRKNRLGGFHYPRAVFCDVRFLGTLDDRQFASGMAEVIKVLTVCDRYQFSRLLANGVAPTQQSPVDVLQELVTAAVRAKVGLLQLDPFEICPARLLNFGHSLAHSIEEQSAFRLTHGEAVMLSLLCEATVGNLLGICPTQELEYLGATAARHVTPASRNLSFSAADVSLALAATRDLRGGHDHLVTIERVGTGRILEHVSEEVVADAWSIARKYFLS